MLRPSNHDELSHLVAGTIAHVYPGTNGSQGRVKQLFKDGAMLCIDKIH